MANPVEFITIEEARDQVRTDNTDDDTFLNAARLAASAAINRYIQRPYYPYEIEIDTNGDEVLNTDGTPVIVYDTDGNPVVLPEVQMATRVLTAILYNDRDFEQTDAWKPGYLPEVVKSLVYHLRMPSMG